MRGEHAVVVRNNRLQIKLLIRRNLTILQGNSATGKTTLLDLIDQYDQMGAASGAIVNCDVPCKVLSGRMWERDLAEIHQSIVFIDEDSAFMRSHDFAHAARKSDNYYVLVARESLPQLPYSVDEIYGLKNKNRSSSKYPVYSRVYASTYRIYVDSMFEGERPELVVVEDSNSGFEFFAALCEKSGLTCVSAGGKDRIYDVVRACEEKSVLVIADGAAFGPEMELVNSLRRFKDVKLFLPESFEWLVLGSGLFEDGETREMLLHPADHIESSEFFSWEQFFTSELISKTRGTYLAYGKSRLNPSYLQERERERISSTLPPLGIL